MKHSLSSCGWTLAVYNPHFYTVWAETGIAKLPPLVSGLKATVPGSVHRDLQAAGLIDPPEYMLNALKCEWTENKAFVYETTFTVSDKDLKRKARITFCGLNLRARIYLNGKLVATHANLHTKCRIDLTGKLKSSNSLTVQFDPHPEDPAQLGPTSGSQYQAQRFAYGWDFSARLIATGIYRDVYIEYYDSLINDFKIATDYREGTGFADIEVHADKGILTTEVLKGGKVLFTSTDEVAGKIVKNVKITDPKLWWPRGYGEQNLYTLRLRLYKDNNIEDERILDFGIRSLSYCRNDNAPEGSLPYTVVINGRKIWLRGANFLPISQFLGEICEKDYDEWFKLITGANLNYLRLWGGGFIESEWFYERCTRFGILVWQDFTQSSSTLDNRPNEKPEFLSELFKSAEEIVTLTRNYTAVTIYNGGNEFKKADLTPADCDNKNLTGLKEIVDRLDGQRLYYPTTASGPNFNNMLDENSLVNRKNHNIHGNWVYDGKEKHCEIYNKSNFQFQAEFGVNGAADEDSIARILDKETINKFSAPDFVWHVRNAGWWDGYPAVFEVFGKTDSIEDFSARSQLVQAEGIRYSVERNRCRAFECSGNGIWAVNEPFPNPNCSCFVNFYRIPKQAYYYIKNCGAQKSISLKYGKLYYKTGERFDGEVYIGSFDGDYNGKVKISVYSMKEQLLEVEKTVSATRDQHIKIHAFDFKIGKEHGDIFFVRLSADGVEADNVYIFGTNAEAPYRGLSASEGKITAAITGDKLIVSNIGATAETAIRIFEIAHTAGFAVSDNYFTLMPGESKTIAVTGYAKGNLKVSDFNRKTNITL